MDRLVWITDDDLNAAVATLLRGCVKRVVMLVGAA